MQVMLEDLDNHVGRGLVFGARAVLHQIAATAVTVAVTAMRSATMERESGGRGRRWVRLTRVVQRMSMVMVGK